jgi:HEAT repeat protein
MGRRPWFVFFISLTSFVVGNPPSEEMAVKRIHSHLFIRDPFSAVKEAKVFKEQFPNSSLLQRAYLKALCQKGEEVDAFNEFSLLLKKDEKEIDLSDRDPLEWLAWGVLNKGESSPLIVVRLYSLLGAAFTRDARAIPIFLKELQGSNSLLRALAVKLSAQYGDAPLREELLRLLKEEKVWFVKLEVIQAIGALKMVEAKGFLQEIIANPKAMSEEKGAAIIALASMYEKISEEELSSLVHHERAGLRELASEIVAHLDFKQGTDFLEPLLKDASPDVRISSMKTLGLLGIARIKEKPVLSLIRKNIEDVHPDVSITAAWLATILGHQEGKDALKKWIETDHLDSRRLAAAALAVTGTQGALLMEEKMKEEKDPYTKVNLAIGLIGQRRAVKESADALFKVISSSEKNLWMWGSGGSGLFRTLSPSKVRHREEMPYFPQMIDQLVKLDILSILSIVGHPRALEAVKEFLKNHSWGVTGAAAATLLQEGDETSLDVVRKLLQAALILALLGGDPAAVGVLIDAYPSVDREMKIHLLEALGHIGDLTAVPFLVSCLKEPFQGLRVVAASALIQCLYH